MSLGSNIKFFRQKMRITQSELARRIGVKNYQLISQYERDIISPKADNLQKIASALKVPVAALLDPSGSQLTTEELESIKSRLSILLKEAEEQAKQGDAYSLAMVKDYGIERIEDIISGITIPSFLDVHKIAVELEVSSDWLLGRTDDKADGVFDLVDTAIMIMGSMKRIDERFKLKYETAELFAEMACDESFADVMVSFAEPVRNASEKARSIALDILDLGKTINQESKSVYRITSVTERIEDPDSGAVYRIPRGTVVSKEEKTAPGDQAGDGEEEE